METGDIIKAKTVISTCGILNTFNKLLPEKYKNDEAIYKA